MEWSRNEEGLTSELFALMECSHGCRDHKSLNLMTVACLQQPQQSQHLMPAVIWNSECKQHGCTLYHSSSTGSRWWGYYAVCLSSAPPPIACSDDWNQIVPLCKKEHMALIWCMHLMPRYTFLSVQLWSLVALELEKLYMSERSMHICGYTLLVFPMACHFFILPPY